jgi:hypothetical protein
MKSDRTSSSETRVAGKSSARVTEAARGADRPEVRCGRGSGAAVELTCPACHHPIAVVLSTPANGNPDIPRIPPDQPPARRLQGTDPDRYSLRREPGCWVLLFEDGQAHLKHELGLDYVAYLLSYPDQWVPSATLFSRFSAGHRKDPGAAELPDPETGLGIPLVDGVGAGQSPRDRDEEEARRRYRAKRFEYKERMGDPTIQEGARAEAKAAYDELSAFLKKHYRPAPSPGDDVTKLVHRSIQRLCDHLRESRSREITPSPVALALAEYIQQHILVPSRRYTRAKAGADVRVARGELAGRLIFECPPGHRWSVVA